MRKLLISTLAILLVTACSEPKKSRGQATTRGARSGSAHNGGGSSGGGGSDPGGTVATLACGQGDWGEIYANGTSDQQWNALVKEFASASVAENEIGYVSPTLGAATGISFCGRICTNNTAAPEIYIGIWDSLYVDGQAEKEISINIKDGGTNHGDLLGSTQGSFLKFEDRFGSVEFTGSTMASGMAQGTFYFQNKLKLENGQEVPGANQRKALGTFQIRADRLWRTNC